MNQISKMNRVVWGLVGLLSSVMLILACCAGCKTPDGSTNAGVVASVIVGDPTQRPAALVRYDANTFVAWGEQAYVSEIYIEQTGLPLWIQGGDAHVAIVKVRKPEFSWKGAPGDILPAEAAVLFRAAEIQAWRLHFEPKMVTP